MLQHQFSDFNIILASGSPRRKELLKELLLDFKVEVMPVDESFPASLEKEEITNYLVQRKADGFRKLKPNEILITGDTIVWHQQKALNKPSDKQEAMEMLHSLSNNAHQVISSIGLTSAQHQIISSDVVDVHFKKLSDEEIEYYVDNFQPFDKAGAYGIQEWIGKIGITSIQGSFYTVMGLPVHLLYENLIQMKQLLTK